MWVGELVPGQFNSLSPIVFSNSFYDCFIKTRGRIINGMSMLESGKKTAHGSGIEARNIGVRR